MAEELEGTDKQVEGTDKGQPSADKGQQVEIAALQAKLEESNKKFNTLSKTHQQAIESGRIGQDNTTSIGKLMEKFEDLEMNQAILSDNLGRISVGDEGLGQTQVATPSRSTVDTLKAQREDRKQQVEMEKKQSEDLTRQRVKLFSTMEKHGINPDDPDVQKYFANCVDIPDALSKITDYLKEQTTLKNSVAKEAEEAKKRAEAEAGGELVSPKGTQSDAQGGIPRTKKALGKYIRELTDDEYLKVKPDIDQLLKQGEIKEE